MASSSKLPLPSADFIAPVNDGDRIIPFYTPAEQQASGITLHSGSGADMSNIGPAGDRRQDPIGWLGPAALDEDVAEMQAWMQEQSHPSQFSHPLQPWNHLPPNPAFDNVMLAPELIAFDREHHAAPPADGGTGVAWEEPLGYPQAIDSRAGEAPVVTSSSSSTEIAALKESVFQLTGRLGYDKGNNYKAFKQASKGSNETESSRTPYLAKRAPCRKGRYHWYVRRHCADPKACGKFDGISPPNMSNQSTSDHVILSALMSTGSGGPRQSWASGDLARCIKKDGHLGESRNTDSAVQGWVEAVRSLALDGAEAAFDALYNLGYRIGEAKSGLSYVEDSEMSPDERIRLDTRIQAAMPPLQETLRLMADGDPGPCEWIRRAVEIRATGEAVRRAAQHHSTTPTLASTKYTSTDRSGSITAGQIAHDLANVCQNASTARILPHARVEGSCHAAMGMDCLKGLPACHCGQYSDADTQDPWLNAYAIALTAVNTDRTYRPRSLSVGMRTLLRSLDGGKNQPTLDEPQRQWARSIFDRVSTLLTVALNVPSEGESSSHVAAHQAGHASSASQFSDTARRHPYKKASGREGSGPMLLKQDVLERLKRAYLEHSGDIAYSDVEEEAVSSTCWQPDASGPA